MLFERTLTRPKTKEDNRSCQDDCKYSTKHFVYKKQTYLAMPLQRLQKFRFFSSACDTIDDNGVVVKHDQTKQTFYVDVDNCGVGCINYDRKGELVILRHTYVSKDLGGRGIGKLLAKEGLKYIAKNNLQLEIQCPFVREYVFKYDPKYVKYIQK